MVGQWEDVLDTIRARAYRTLDRELDVPDRDGWFTVDADLIYARLLGFEDEVVEDVRLSKLEPVLFMPVRQSMRRVFQEASDAAFLDRAGIFDPDLFAPSMRQAQYRLQAGFVTMQVAGEYQPPVDRLRDDNTAVLAFVRYRRRA